MILFPVGCPTHFWTLGFAIKAKNKEVILLLKDAGGKTSDGLKEH
jgi:hypothetical protein